MHVLYQHHSLKCVYQYHIYCYFFSATRLNWYRDSKEWKPFHHDAAAIKPDKAKTQNLTVGVSFGAERDAAFEHAKTKTVMSMPQPNGTIYVFAKDVNIIWRHGILQVLKILSNPLLLLIFLDLPKSSIFFMVMV